MRLMRGMYHTLLRVSGNGTDVAKYNYFNNSGLQVAMRSLSSRGVRSETYSYSEYSTPSRHGTTDGPHHLLYHLCIPSIQRFRNWDGATLANPLVRTIKCSLFRPFLPTAEIRQHLGRPNYTSYPRETIFTNPTKMRYFTKSMLYTDSRISSLREFYLANPVRNFIIRIRGHILEDCRHHSTKKATSITSPVILGYFSSPDLIARWC